MRFQDKVCLVTGGGSGIGRAACERFATEGGRVVVVDLNDEHGADAVKAIVASGGHAIFAKANVAKKTKSSHPFRPRSINGAAWTLSSTAQR